MEYDDLMKFEDAEYQRTLLTTPTSATTESGIEIKECAYGKPSDDVQVGLLDITGIRLNKNEFYIFLDPAGPDHQGKQGAAFVMAAKDPH